MYTEGEWWLELRPDDNVRRVRTSSEAIADVFGTNAEDEANAQLISAAPDLYEACKAINNYLEAPYPENMKLKKVAVEKLDKALAKAEVK